MYNKNKTKFLNRNFLLYIVGPSFHNFNSEKFFTGIPIHLSPPLFVIAYVCIIKLYYNNKN